MNKKDIVIVCSPLPSGGRGLSLQQNFKKGGGLDRISIFRGGLLVKTEVGIGLRTKKIKYYRGSLKNPIFRGWGFTKNQYMGRELAKRGGGAGQFADLRGAWRKRGGVFLRGVDTPMHIMIVKSKFWISANYSFDHLMQ